MKRIVIAVVLTGFLLSGCMGIKSKGNSTLLEFIKNGQVSRTDVILKLGEPSASLESGRILTYRIGGDGQEGYYIRETKNSWSGTNYSLVFVFDAQGILQSHSLVPVR
jgi:hypothetical protein